jgi:hypothetical protein
MGTDSETDQMCQCGERVKRSYLDKDTNEMKYLTYCRECRNDFDRQKRAKKKKTHPGLELESSPKCRDGCNHPPADGSNFCEFHTERRRLTTQLGRAKKAEILSQTRASRLAHSKKLEAIQRQKHQLYEKYGRQPPEPPRPKREVYRGGEKECKAFCIGVFPEHEFVVTTFFTHTIDHTPTHKSASLTIFTGRVRTR